MKTLIEHISQVKTLHSLNEFITESKALHQNVNIAENKALHQNVNISESKALHQNVNVTEKLVINKNYKSGPIELVDEIITYLNIERFADDDYCMNTMRTSALLSSKIINDIKNKLVQYIDDNGYGDFDPRDVQYRIPRKQGDDLPEKIKRRYRITRIIPNDFNADKIFVKDTFSIRCLSKNGNPNINGSFLRISCHGPFGGVRWAELIKNV